VNVRAITLDDADAVAALAAEDEIALRGRTHLGPSDVREWWSRGDLDDSWLFEENGRVAGAGWFSPWGDLASFAGVVAQEWKGCGIGSDIAEHCEQLARTRGFTRIHTWVLLEDVAAAELFRGRGYAEVRRFYEMALELDSQPPEPVVPDGVVLDGFRPDDAQAFHAAIEEAFQDHWDWHGTPFDEWWKKRSAEDQSLWFVIRDGGEIAAAVRNQDGIHGGGYVGIIGVRRAWRGLGLGKALLYRTFGEFWRRGVTRVTLGVDAESPTGATKLYESVGMHVEGTNLTYEKILA
jgi:mycothiol synthase